MSDLPRRRAVSRGAAVPVVGLPQANLKLEVGAGCEDAYVSFVIPCRNEGDYLRTTIESIEATAKGVPYEIIVVDNGSTDDCSQFLRHGRVRKHLRLLVTDPLGVAGARTFGLERAYGKIVFFCDGHVTFNQNWLEPCLQVLERPEVGMVAPASAVWGNSEATGYGMRWKDARFNGEWLGRAGEDPYPIPMAAGFCTGMRKDYFQAIGGYDSGMRGYGMEDLEICLRIWLLGKQVWVVPSAVCSHLFREAHPYPVSWATYLVNMIRTAGAHFSTPRLQRCLSEWKSMHDFEQAMAQELSGDLWGRRQALFDQRVRSDDWFFERFGLNF